MTTDATTTSSRNSRSFAAVIFLSLVVALTAISGESLWIDEAFTAKIAMQRSFADWWGAMLADKGSDLQMPLYMAYLCIWEKLTGHSEWALRLANLPWFLFGQAALWFGLRARPRLRVAVVVLACASPFLWFYLNEARPYVMQYAAACVLVGFLARLATRDGDAAPVAASLLWLVGLGTLVLCGSSALGIPWAGSAGLASIILGVGPRRIRWSPSGFVALVVTAIGLGQLGYYFLWTAKQGASPAVSAGTTVANLVFALYELLGFAGLGPARLLIRETGFAAFHSFVPYLLMMALGLAAIVGAALFRLLRVASARMWLAGFVYVLLPVGFIFTLGTLTGFRVLGRHFAPLAPVVLIACGTGVNSLWFYRNRLMKIVAVAFVALWFASSLSLRFCPLHRKDDYRAAAEIALTELQAGRSVWWAAASAGADYYHLPLSQKKPVPGRALEVCSPSQVEIAQLPPADTVVLSKKDLFDAQGAIGALLEEKGYSKTRTLPAFTIWRQSGGAGSL